jgi:4-hydroxy-2-oxoheptanedioate aldolase
MGKLVIGLILITAFPLRAVAQTSPGGRLNRTIELLAGDKPVFGVFGWNHSVDNAIALARSGLDFVIIDMEHRPFDMERLRAFLLGMTDKGAILEKGSLQMNVTPIVRLPTSNSENTAVLAKQVLGMGAFGLMFPSVNTKEEALNAVRASRYPQATGSPDMEPHGLRGFEPFHPGMWYWGLGRQDYYRLADLWPLDAQGEILVVFQIETGQGVDNIEEIVSVPGLGAVLVGSWDLSTSLGVPGEVDGPEVGRAVQSVLRACLARGIPVGATAGELEERLEQGFRFLTVGSDVGLTAGAAANLERARKASGR